MDDGIEKILQRLDSIEARLAQLETNKLDASAYLTSRQPEPPPSYRPLSSPPRPTSSASLTGAPGGPPQGSPPLQGPPYYGPYNPPRPPRQPQPKEPRKAGETEYYIGAKVLPIVAAVIICLGLAYLVSFSIQNGWITPPMLFGGVSVLCLAFVGGGVALRNEREQFGQILTGVGSCGLYLNFAAGHVFQNLYGLQILIFLYSVLSLVNLGYGMLRASTAFWSIGVVGGLAGAAMPLHLGDTTLSMSLVMLISGVAAVISGIHGWRLPSAALVVAPNAICVPALWMASGTNPAIPILLASYSSSLMAGAAYSWKSTSPDLPVGFALGILAFINLVSKGGQFGLKHTALFAAACMVTSVAFRPRASSTTFLASGIAIFTLVSPMGLSTPNATLAFGSFAIMFGIASIFIMGRMLSQLAVAQLLFGVVGYLGSIPLIGFGQELGLLALLMVASVVVAYGFIRATGPDDTKLNLAGVLVACGLVRAVDVFVVQQFALPAMLALNIAALAGIFGLAAFAFATKRTSTTSVAAVAFGLGIAAYWLGLQRDFSLLNEIALLPFFTLALIGIFLCIPAKAKGRMDGLTLSVAAGGLLFVRFVWVFADWQKWDTHAATSISLAMTIFAGALGFFALPSRKGLLGVGVAYGALGVCFAIGSKLYPAESIPFTVPTLLSLAVIVFLTIQAIKSGIDDQLPLWATSLASWVLISNLAVGILPLQNQAALTAGWIVTVVALLVVGFAFDRAALRYGSFVVIAATIGKVMFVDLANTSPVIRILILMALGLALLAGGYVYIQRQKSKDDPRQNPADHPTDPT